MSKIAQFILFFVISTFPVSIVLAQGAAPPRNNQRQDADFEERRRNLEFLNNGALENKRDAFFRNRNKPPKPLTREEKERIKSILAIDPEVSAKYAQFLKQPKTGVFRIFPDLNCANKNVVRTDDGCGELVSNSWFYSIRAKDYSDSELFDIQLKNGQFISRGILVQSIIVSLGDIPLENLTVGSAGMKFLTDFLPDANFDKVRDQFDQIADVPTLNGFSYAHRAKAEENTTYALRVIAYQPDKNFSDAVYKDLSNPEMQRLGSVLIDKRADMIIGFRVVRKDSDGGLTILWKELIRGQAPRLIYAKNNRITDFK